MNLTFLISLSIRCKDILSRYQSSKEINRPLRILGFLGGQNTGMVEIEWLIKKDNATLNTNRYRKGEGDLLQMHIRH